MHEPRPEHVFGKILSPGAITALRLEWRLLDELHYRFQVDGTLSDKSVIRGGGDVLEIVGELEDPWEMDRGEGVLGDGIRDAGEPESRSNSIHSKGLGSISSYEQTP